MTKKKPQQKEQQIPETNNNVSPSVTPLKKTPENLEARRHMVLIKWIEGKNSEQIALELGVASRTIKRDLIEIRKERIAHIQGVIKHFDANDFIGKRLRELEERRQQLWTYARAADRFSVQALKELREVGVEEEDLYRRLGVKTSEVKPGDLMGNGTKIAVFTGAPPPGYKMPEGYVADNPPEQPSNGTSKKPKVSS